MASSAYAPYTQAERRSVPSRVNPTLVAAASIGVLSVRVSICRRCSPFTANPYSQSVCRTSTPNPRPRNGVAGRSRCEPSGCVCRCARAGPRRPVPATPVRQRRSTLPGPKVRSRRRANDPNLAGWACPSRERRPVLHSELYDDVPRGHTPTLARGAPNAGSKALRRPLASLGRVRRVSVGPTACCRETPRGPIRR